MGNSSTKNSLKTDSGKVKDDKRTVKKIEKKKGKGKGIFTKRKPSLANLAPKGAAPSAAPLILTSFEPVEDGASLNFDPDEEVLNRLRVQLRGDLETFVLNNVLMSVQFFEHYEREIASLRASPTSDVEAERNTRLLQCQKHCVSPDKLHEIVSKRVRFRPQHGSKKHCMELLNSPRLLVVQDNVELYEGTDSVDYSSVLTGPIYRLTMENTDKHGYVKLRSDDKQHPTYEAVVRKSDEDVTYSRIIGDDSTPSPRDSDKLSKTIRKDVEPMVEDVSKEGAELSEGQKMMLALQVHIEGSGKREGQSDTDAAPSEKMPQHFDSNFVKNNRKKFGPQSVSVKSTNSKSSGVSPLTRTERRLSGIIKGTSNIPKFVAPIPLSKLQRQNQLQSAKSMPNLSENPTADPSSNKSSLGSDSSGYKSGSSSLRTNLSLPNSRGSDVDYGYTTIVGFSTPKPLETQRLGNIPINSMAIPEQCFKSIDVRLINSLKPGSYNPSMHGQGTKLFETRQYLNSRAYIGNFGDVFAEGLSGILGIHSESLDSATMQGHQIFCEHLEEGRNLIPYKMKKIIIPTLTSSTWPEAGFEWTRRKRKRFLDEENNKTFTWPTQHMITQVKRFGCHVLPVGYMPCRGENPSRDLEWRLAFPEAERYLESCLSHAQVRCYMFTLALYKNFMEPINAELGLTSENIRTQLLWQCEKNYLAWPEDRPGETLQKFLGSLYDALKRENLPDYFLINRNQFESTPRSHMRRIQEKLCRIRENLTMHVLAMVRNLRYVNEDSFYPRLDFKKLYEIITTEQIITLVNPALARSIQNNQEDSDEEESEEEEESLTDLWAEVRRNDPGRQWNRKVYRQIEAEKVVQKLTQEFTRQSVDSIDLTLLPGKVPESIRRQLLLELLIPHFIELARKSNEFRAPKQGRMFINHAECLAKLLAEEPSNNGLARKLLIQIRSLRESSTVGYNELKSPVKIQSNTTPMFIPNSYKKLDSPTSKSPPIHDLPPVPPSSKPLPHPSMNNYKGLKRLSFVLPKEESNGNSTVPKVLKTPPIAVITSVKSMFEYEQSVTLEAAVEEESTDYDDSTYF